MNKIDLIELEELIYAEEVSEARKGLLDFTTSTMEGFNVEPFHEQYYTLLEKFSRGEIKKLIITMPPQHGKSEGSSRRLPAYMLGLNPNLKIAIASYNSIFASKFNRDVQRIIDTQKYHDVFPETRLNASQVVTVSSNFLRNATEFEIVEKKGGLKAVGRGGALTGSKVDCMIMDDLYKDYMEGNSPVIREAVWDWYTSVVVTRLHNDSQQLIVFTRWHEDDLIGRIEAMGKVKEIKDLADLETLGLKHNEWLKVNFEAVKTGDPTPIDPRQKGEPLWGNLHSLEKLNDVKEMDIEKFNCLYQGNPKSKAGLLYSDFKTYEELPEFKIIKNYTDTADTGKDKLCSIVYGVPLSPTDKHLYILDVLYTDKPMEDTEPLTAALLLQNNVNECRVESNNGGRGFARAVQKMVTCYIDWFHQGANKEARIFSNSATVNYTLVMPKDWFLRWSEFYEDVTSYKKLFKANAFDDAPDTMTGIIEWEATHTGEYDIR